MNGGGAEVRSNRAMDLGFGGVFAACGIVLILRAGDGGTVALGLASALFGFVLAVRRRAARIADDGIELQSCFRRRRYRWGGVARVAVDGRWSPYRLLRLELSNGRHVVGEGIGTFRRGGSALDAFAVSANAMAYGPSRPPDRMSRRVKWFFVIAFALGFALIAIGAVVNH
jgi:hypothetical protein